MACMGKIQETRVKQLSRINSDSIEIKFETRILFKHNLKDVKSYDIYIDYIDTFPLSPVFV